MRYYCVYFHRRQDNGEIFYIGKGSLRSKRHLVKYGRSSVWQAVANSVGFTVEIVEDNLTHSEALERENHYLLIHAKSSWLCNAKTSQKYRDLKKQDFINFVNYDESSPSGLRWKVKAANSKNSVAGTLNQSGYWLVSINGVKYPAHRVVWAIVMGGELRSDIQINHINHNKADNNIHNLECVTALQNNQKRKMHSGATAKNNKTGTTGVSFSQSANKFVVSWVDHNYRFCTKSFSVSIYGYDQALDLARIYKEHLTYISQLRRGEISPL